MFSTIRKIWVDWFGGRKDEQQQHIPTFKRSSNLDDDVMVHNSFPKRRRLINSDALTTRCSSDGFLCPARDFTSNRMQSNSLFSRTALPSAQVQLNQETRGNNSTQETKENIISISDSEEDKNSQSGVRRKTFNSASEEKEETEWRTLKPFSKREKFLSQKNTSCERSEADPEIQVLKMVGKNEGGIPYRRIAVMERTRDITTKPHSSFRTKSSSNATITPEKINPARKFSVNESFRLEEKKKYSELLQKFTRVPVTISASSPLEALRSSNEKRRYGQLNTAKTNKSETVEFIDLTKQKDRASSRDSVSSDIEVLVSKIRDENLENGNNFIMKTKENPMYDPRWTTDLTLMYDHKTLDRRRKEEQEKLKIQLRSQRSKEVLQEFLEEQIHTHLRITEVALPEEIITLDDEEELKLPKLTTYMEKMVNAAFQRGNPAEVLVECFSQRITRRDILTLSANNWLNDEVINFYMNLLIERGKQGKYPSMYGFNTFFYPKLLQYGHSSLKRWTRKIDVFSHSILIVPVHLGVHWCMAAIDLRKKSIRYFDSMGAPNPSCLRALMQYLEDEMWDKKKERFNRTGWKTENVQNIPQQMNGSDCGMFACMYAEFICREAKITFTQADMPYFRRKMAYEILSKKLLI